MEETKRRILIENDLRPAYYDDFHCLMGDCRLNCCAWHWRIAFDRKDYLKVKKQKGSPELNAKLEHCLRRIRKGGSSEEEYAEFATDGSPCPLWDENGLCTLQREKGYHILPQVCQRFPRLGSARFSGYYERSLSPACEGVLALLWELPDGVEFRSGPLPKEERSNAVLPEGNPLAENYQEIRSLCVDFLQDRRRPLSHRILLLGLVLKRLAEGETNITRFMEYGRFMLEQGDAGELLRDLDASRTLESALHSNIRTLLSLRNEKGIQPLLRELEQWLSLKTANGQLQANQSAYLSARERYKERFGERAYFMENLMVVLFFSCGMPDVRSPEKLWESYVTFCGLYAAFQFISIMSCREGAPGDREELFRLLVITSRTLLHSQKNPEWLPNEFFQSDSATLAHMAVLVCVT